MTVNNLTQQVFVAIAILHCVIDYMHQECIQDITECITIQFTFFRRHTNVKICIRLNEFNANVRTSMINNPLKLQKYFLVTSNRSISKP